jgi:putative flippase GtrA
LSKKAKRLDKSILGLRRKMTHRAAHLAVYCLISAGALGIDVSTAGLLFKSGLAIPISASVGYVAGLVVAFPLMRSLVFKSRNIPQSREFWLFMISGALGVGMTSTFSFLGSELMGLGFTGSKFLAVFASFSSVFLFRYNFVFAELANVEQQSSR